LTAERLKKLVLALSSESFPQHFQHNKLFLNLQSISVISSFFECLLRVVKCSVCSDPFSIPSRFHQLCILLTKFNFFEVFQFFLLLAIVVFPKIPFIEGRLTILWPPELAGFQCITAQFYYKGICF
jgi:hypothetical protein